MDADDAPRCAECGEPIPAVEDGSAWSDDKAHAEAVRNFGVRGDAPGMSAVCGDCYRAIMARIGRGLD